MTGGERTTPIRTRCPWCKRVNEMASNLFTAGKPKDGDVSVCAGCHKPAIFTQRLALRKPTSRELPALVNNKRLSVLTKALDTIRKGD